MQLWSLSSATPVNSVIVWSIPTLWPPQPEVTRSWTFIHPMLKVRACFFVDHQCWDTPAWGFISASRFPSMTKAKTQRQQLHLGVQWTVSAQQRRSHTTEWVYKLSWVVHKAADVWKCWSCHYSERLKGFCEAASWWVNQYALMVTEPPLPLICEKTTHWGSSRFCGKQYNGPPLLK